MTGTEARPRPSVLRIVQSDLIALLGFLAPLVFLVLTGAMAVNGSLPAFRGHDVILWADAGPSFVIMTLAAFVIGFSLAIWRIRGITGVFARGAEVPGRVTSVWFTKDRGTVKYEYAYQGRDYTGANGIMKTGRTAKLVPGMELTLVVDSRDPGRALIRDLYT